MRKGEGTIIADPRLELERISRGEVRDGGSAGRCEGGAVLKGSRVERREKRVLIRFTVLRGRASE